MVLTSLCRKVDLPAAFQFAQAGLADDPFGKAADERFDRQPPLRRGRDDGKIPQAFQRHGKRARNRCGGERQYIHFRAQIFQLLFVAHAKAMLLVNNDQPQVFEFHVLSG